ncbi:MAG TPA: hypothetical protein VJ745_03245 [Gaiellaceae bacterium]|nr:hypothetical protein [Gaiellaceae bacterium]
MARIVVVASSDLPRAALSDAVSPDDELRIVVPAVEQSRLQWLTNDEDGARAEAYEVGEAISRAAPAEATNVEVKSDLPRQLVLDAIAEHHPAKIVVALREGEGATWLEDGELDGLPTEIEGIPVVRISV